MSTDHSLNRFVEAQTLAYHGALGEIRRGAKRSHWMWYIFPQLIGLGTSETARHFAIRSLDEARAYLEHPVLGRRYTECVEALQDLATCDPEVVFGSTDAMKLRSSLTLFEAAQPQPLISAALARWLDDHRDPLTLELLSTQVEPAPRRAT